MKRALSILLAALLVLMAVPTFAEDNELETGLYVSDDGQERMYLYDEGVGILIAPAEEEGWFYSSGVVWTGSSLEIERGVVPFALSGAALSFTYMNRAMVLHYQGESEGFDIGDPAGYTFAGEYESEDGKKLTLTSDGQGVYADAAGEQPVFWGSYYPMEEYEEPHVCYILFGSFLCSMDFVDGQVQIDDENAGKTTFSPVAPAAAPAPAAETADGTTVISAAYDLALTLPSGGWTVEETEAGLLVTRNADLIQYTFISLPLDAAPNVATLDAYADHIWTDGLMGAGVAYDAADTVRGDHAVGAAAGRTAAAEWTRDEAAYTGDAILWYADGRLYVALSVAAKDTRAQALALLDQALLTFRPAEDASPVTQLPMDKAVFESIKDLPPVVTVAAEEVYYGYKMTSDGQSFELIPFLTAMGVDPRAISLTLRADGTGRLMFLDEDDSAEFTWNETTFTSEGESIPYTRVGSHIIMSSDGEFIEFVPAAEFEKILGETEAAPKMGPVTPTAEALVGSWTFTKARAMGMEIPASMMGTEMSLVLSDDGTAILLADGSPTELRWTIREDEKVALTAAGEEIFLMTYDGSVLTLITDAESVEMIFEKDA